MRRVTVQPCNTTNVVISHLLRTEDILSVAERRRLEMIQRHLSHDSAAIPHMGGTMELNKTFNAFNEGLRVVQLNNLRVY